MFRSAKTARAHDAAVREVVDYERRAAGEQAIPAELPVKARYVYGL